MARLCSDSSRTLSGEICLAGGTGGTRGSSGEMTGWGNRYTKSRQLRESIPPEAAPRNKEGCTG
jgi:hypothetical protein